VPVEWTNYEYDLSAWNNQNVYLAWRCLSVDAMALFLDNIEVFSYNGYVSNQDIELPKPLFLLLSQSLKGLFYIREQRWNCL